MGSKPRIPDMYVAPVAARPLMRVVYPDQCWDDTRKDFWNRPDRWDHVADTHKEVFWSGLGEYVEQVKVEPSPMAQWMAGYDKIAPSQMQRQLEYAAQHPMANMQWR